MAKEITKDKKAQSFPKSQRLLKNFEFVRIQKIGRRFHTKNFIVIIAEDQKDPARANKSKSKIKIQSASNCIESQAKLGITITKKLEKTAVKRNRVKRMIRAAFLQFKSHCVASISLVVIAKTGSSELKTPEVYRQLFGALKFNGFIKEIKSS